MTFIVRPNLWLIFIAKIKSALKAEQGLVVPFFRIFCLSKHFTLYGMIFIKVLAKMYKSPLVLAINLGTTILNVITIL